MPGAFFTRGAVPLRVSGKKTRRTGVHRSIPDARPKKPVSSWWGETWRNQPVNASSQKRHKVPPLRLRGNDQDNTAESSGRDHPTDVEMKLAREAHAMATKIMQLGDSHCRNGQLTINEASTHASLRKQQHLSMRWQAYTFLKNTPHAAFLLWLTADYQYSFKHHDEDGSGCLGVYTLNATVVVVMPQQSQRYKIPPTA